MSFATGRDTSRHLGIVAQLLARPTKLRRRIERLYELAGASLDAELQKQASGSDMPAERQSSATKSSSDRDATPATVPQKRAILSLARAKGIDPSEFVFERTQCHHVDQLTLRQASRLIDELRQLPEASVDFGLSTSQADAQPVPTEVG